jgi:hypothetical protein
MHLTTHKTVAAAKVAATPAPVASVTPLASKPSAGVGYSGVGAHDTNVAAAELTRQNAVAAATTQSALTTANINYHRAIATSALANGVSPSVSMSALKALGVTGL